MKIIQYTSIDHKVGLDEEGYPILDVDNIVDKSFAYKTISDDNKINYFIRHGYNGSPLMTNEDNRPKSRFEKALGKQEPKSFFRRTNETAFKNYLTYLKTKNPLYYKIAIRNM